MKKNNKAFTLIELLAIIVILAIIAVITVPIILNIIENSRMGAATDSAYGFKDAISKYYVSELSNNGQLQLDGDYTVTDGVLNGSGIENKTIPVSGTVPTSGTLKYSKNILTSGCLVIGEYAVTFNADGTTSTEKGGCSSSSLTQYGYKSNGDTEITISTSNPTGKNAYLKYDVENGEVVNESVRTCIYSETYSQKEFCLKKQDFETSLQSIKDYFKWNDETSSSEYQGVTCYTPTWGGFSCMDSSVGMSVGTVGSVSAGDIVSRFGCRINDSEAACY